MASAVSDRANAVRRRADPAEDSDCAKESETDGELPHLTMLAHRALGLGPALRQAALRPRNGLYAT